MQRRGNSSLQIFGEGDCTNTLQPCGGIYADRTVLDCAILDCAPLLQDQKDRPLGWADSLSCNRSRAVTPIASVPSLSAAASLENSQCVVRIKKALTTNLLACAARTGWRIRASFDDFFCFLKLSSVIELQAIISVESW